MSIGTYAELKTAVARWVGGSDVSDATSLGFPSAIADIVTIAEARINREVHSKDNEDSTTPTVAAGVVAVPADYQRLRYAYVNGTPVTTLERRTLGWIYTTYGTRTASGLPKYIARDGSNFVFGPYPDSAYTVKLGYYKKMPALSSSAHALFTNNPDLYLFGCLAEVEILVGHDARIKLWEAKYNNILNDVNGFDSAENASGSPLVMRLG